MNIAEMVDISEVFVDLNLPKEQRIEDFVRQVKDPYHYACEGSSVTAQFSKTGPTLEDCLNRLLAS